MPRSRVIHQVAAGLIVGALVAGCAGRQPQPFKLVDGPRLTTAVEPANYPDTTRIEVPAHEPQPFPALQRAVTPTDNDQVEVLIARGRLLLRHYRPLQARAIFDESLRRFPDTAIAFAGRALTFLAESDLASADQELDRALSRSKREPLVLIAAARMAAAHKEYQRAYGFASQAIDADDQDVEAHWTRYEVSRLAGDAERAVADLERALQLDPAFPPALVSYAGIAMRSGKTDDAITVLSRLASRDPEQAVYYLYRSEAQDLAGRRREAIADASTAVDLSPSNAGYLRHRGFLNEQAGSTDAAEQDYRQAIRLDPESPFGYLRLAVLAANQGDLALALPLAEDALRRARPIDARDDVLLMHSTVIAAYGETEQAYAELTEAIGINGRRASLRLRRAEVATTLHRFDDAREDLIWVQLNAGSDRDRQLAETMLNAIGTLEIQDRPAPPVRPTSGHIIAGN